MQRPLNTDNARQQSTGPRLRPDRSVERFGDVLLGGSPLRVMRFGERVRTLLDALWPQARAIDGSDPSTATSSGKEIVWQASSTLAPEGASPAPNLAAVVDRLIGAGMLHPVPERRQVTTAPSRFADDPTGARAINVTIVTPALANGHRTVRTLPHSVVVDDGSEPPLATAAIRLVANRGPAAARNAGLATVTTDLVAFVDTDVTVDDDWLERLVGHFADPTVALVAPRVRPDPVTATSTTGTTTTRLARYEYGNSPLDLGSEPALVAPGARVGYVPATAVVVRTETLRLLGGFDPALRFGEDVDLVWRLVAAGFRCRYEPSVVVTHPARSTWRAWFRQRVSYGTSAAALAERHGKAVAPARLNRWSLIAWVLALGGPLSRLAAVTATFVSAAAFPRRVPALPPRRAMRLAIVGTWKAGDQLATAVRRGWWPGLLAAAIVSRRARRALLLSIVAARDPVRVVDDVAYSVGVWKGCWVHRSVRALTPIIT